MARPDRALLDETARATPPDLTADLTVLRGTAAQWVRSGNRARICAANGATAGRFRRVIPQCPGTRPERGTALPHAGPPQEPLGNRRRSGSHARRAGSPPATERTPHDRCRPRDPLSPRLAIHSSHLPRSHQDRTTRCRMPGRVIGEQSGCARYETSDPIGKPAGAPAA